MYANAIHSIKTIIVNQQYSKLWVPVHRLPHGGMTTLDPDYYT